MRCADVRDPDCQSWVLPHDKARRPCVVEMDVGEEQMAEVGEGEPVRREAGPQCRQGRGRPAVEQREPVRGLDEVDTDRLLAPA